MKFRNRKLKKIGGIYFLRELGRFAYIYEAYSLSELRRFANNLTDICRNSLLRPTRILSNEQRASIIKSYFDCKKIKFASDDDLHNYFREYIWLVVRKYDSQIKD